MILKIHGTIDKDDELIFSKHQYAIAKYKHKTFYRLLDTLALTRTFIFLGCGLNDPDIKLVLENNNFIYPGCRPHYFVAAKSMVDEEMKKVLKSNYNLNILEYSLTRTTGHDNLLTSLNALCALVEDVRHELSTTQNW